MEIQMGASRPAAAGRTLYQKLWDAHVVAEAADGQTLLYIDRHLLHEVSTPQSFAAMRAADLVVRRPETQLAVADHAVPTTHRDRPIADPDARAQVALLERNCAAFGIDYLRIDGPDQGIVHVVGPEQGFTLPGITLVCGDSHSATHGAFGALAFGIGASECGTVMATQVLWQRKAQTLRVTFAGERPAGVTAKDMALALIGQIGASVAASIVSSRSKTASASPPSICQTANASSHDAPRGVRGRSRI